MSLTVGPCDLGSAVARCRSAPCAADLAEGDLDGAIRPTQCLTGARTILWAAGRTSCQRLQSYRAPPNTQASRQVDDGSEESCRRRAGAANPSTRHSIGAHGCQRFDLSHQDARQEPDGSLRLEHPYSDSRSVMVYLFSGDPHAGDSPTWHTPGVASACESAPPGTTPCRAVAASFRQRSPDAGPGVAGGSRLDFRPSP
jgi:hypothetical protein